MRRSDLYVGQVLTDSTWPYHFVHRYRVIDTEPFDGKPGTVSVVDERDEDERPLVRYLRSVIPADEMDTFEATVRTPRGFDR